MTGLKAAARYAALYTPRVDDLILPLQDVGVSLAAALEALSSDPNQERVAHVLIRLEGIRRHLIQLHEVLASTEDGSDGL